MFKEAILHELIHYYDWCTVKIDWNNIKHVACSEIRAAHLSGDCSLTNEINRGRIGSFKSCVRRRALLSMTLKFPNIHALELGNEVDRVFDQCFADTAPFSL